MVPMLSTWQECDKLYGSHTYRSENKLYRLKNNDISELLYRLKNDIASTLVMGYLNLLHKLSNEFYKSENESLFLNKNFTKRKI